ncbi:hypothetical protein OPT61_g1351 [Boeremia exigua]|uniref:Uncharacterized protein n=1 Tax=Boeremia exigua TaxID=749465 RepID=A0ACC2IQL2_9PLEO|nr:hypothetical protein OPT61_g1351 [Boeremia exigua]
MSHENVDRLYWLAYAKIVQNQVGKLGEQNAIFLSTKNQRGPPVEPYNSAFTDYGIYHFANQLLNSDNMFYAPSSTNTYTGALMAYLSWVDVGGNPTNAQMLDVMQKKKTFDAHQTAVMKALKQANADYQDSLNMGMVPPGQKFSHLTMQVTASPPPPIADAYNAYVDGTVLPAPTDLYTVAQFGSPDYRNIVSGWQRTATNAPMRTQSFVLDLKEAQNAHDADFGHVKLDGDLGFSYGSIFSFGATGSSDVVEDSLSVKMTETNVKITMYWDDTAKATLTPGEWNISDPRGNYPNLKLGAPQSAKMLVLPNQLVLVSKLGYDVHFDGSIKDEFDKKVSNVKKVNGYVRIFGIPVSVGAQGSFETTTTHTGSWDGTTGTFSVKPTADAGYATVLAVVGEKVRTF